uniref:Uncharacterized protein n=1 Tax=Anopheles albimanus TaxID=7167 RepID=A0A182FXV4_ANOAL
MVAPTSSHDVYWNASVNLQNLQ